MSENETLTLAPHQFMPMDFICKGFSMKDTILEVLSKYNNGERMDFPIEELGKIAEEIMSSLAHKLRIKHGSL